MKSLENRIIAAERAAEARRIKLPPGWENLSAEVRRQIHPKERTRAIETALYLYRATPAHAFELNQRQVEVAVQIGLDVLFPNTPSPFDIAASAAERADVEAAVRDQMARGGMDAPIEPLRSRALQEYRDARAIEPTYQPA